MEQSKTLEAEKVRLISTRSTIDEVGGIESDVVSRFELSTREILNLFSAVTLNNSFSTSELADLKRRVYELRFHGVEIPRAEEFIDLKVDASLTWDASGSVMGKHFGAFLVENPLIRVERSGEAPIDGELYRTLAAVYLESLDDNLNPNNYLIISVPLFERLRPAQTLVYLSFSGDLVVTRFYSDAQFSSEEPTPEIRPSGRQILILSLGELRSEIPEILELLEGSLNRRLRVNDENARFHLPKRGQSANF